MGAWGARELMGDIVVGQTGDDLIQYGCRACVAAGFVLPCPQCMCLCVLFCRLLDRVIHQRCQRTLHIAI